jgi:hypothetical protein
MAEESTRTLVRALSFCHNYKITQKNIKKFSILLEFDIVI